MANGSACLTLPPCLPGQEPDLDRAFEGVGADVFARSSRLCGQDIRLLAPVVEEEPAARRWRAILEALGVAHDEPACASLTDHQHVTKALFFKLHDQGDICEAAGGVGFCPRCGVASAGGSCPGCGGQVTRPAGGAYCLCASRRRQAIAEQLGARPDFIWPMEDQRAVAKAVMDGAIADLCVSSAACGGQIPLPVDPSQRIGASFETLAAYLTSNGYLVEPQAFERCWPPRLQVVPRWTLRAHALAWPAMLIALGLPLPGRLVARGSLEVEGAPLSGSDPAALAARLGSDPIRLALLRSADYTAGGRLRFAELIELAGPPLDTLWLLAETVLATILERRDGRVPRPGPFAPGETELAAEAGGLFEATGAAVASFDFRGALDRLWDTIDKALGYARQAGVRPDHPAAASEPRLDTSLYILAETLRLIAHSMQPFLPGAAAAILDSFDTATEDRAPSLLARWGVTPPGTRVRRVATVFPRRKGVRSLLCSAPARPWTAKGS